MSKTFTLAEVNDLELSAAENATILERERIIKLLEERAISAAYASKKPEKEPYVLAWWDAVAFLKEELK